MVKIAHLPYRALYLVTVWPNSHLTNSVLRLNSSLFEDNSKSLAQPLQSRTCSLFGPIHMQSRPNVKLGQV